MRVAQIVVQGASEYERKHHRIDSADAVPLAEAELVHLYAPRDFPAAAVRGIRQPYVASGAPRQSFFRRVPEPSVLITPENVPEAVEAGWFENRRGAGSPAGEQPERLRHVIGSFLRPSVKNAIEQSLARIHRFRDDIDWLIFERAPQPSDLTGVDAWIDPATDEDDLDGFVAEALVSGVPVVATRTRINLRRTQKGHNAFVVPANDPNELTHAILAALFKSEVAGVKIEGAWRAASMFRPRQRHRVLARIYEEILVQRP
jgi:glycosyl transferase family 1